jgi:hypothetical protein
MASEAAASEPSHADLDPRPRTSSSPELLRGSGRGAGLVARLGARLGLGLSLGCAVASGACEMITGGRTSVVLDVTLTAQATDVPEELRVFVRHGTVILFEDQRLPKAGKLVPRALPDLGSIVLDLGEVAGDLDVDIFGLRGGMRKFFGRTRVIAESGRETGARIELAPMPGNEPPGSGPGCRLDAECGPSGYCRGGMCHMRKAAGEPCGPDGIDPSGNHQCETSFCASGRCCRMGCGICQSCTGPGGTCLNVERGGEDLRSGLMCKNANACDGRGVCRKKDGQACASPLECASGFCVDGMCCENACNSPCRRCGTGRCTAIADAIDPRSCAGDRMCDATGECLKRTGLACVSGRECASGFCVDGACCNGACGEPCETCWTGTCTVRTNSTDRECTNGRSCDANGVCRVITPPVAY